MSQKGIMAEIRALLAQDKSAKEVISLGYKPSTVYRAQQQLEEGLPQPGLLPPQGSTQVVVNNNIEPQTFGELGELKEENTLLNQQLAAQVMELELVREELAQVTALNKELKSEASQAKEERGEVLMGNEVYFVSAPTIRTSSEKYGWLNHVQCIGKMTKEKLGDDAFVEYDIFIVR